MRGCLFCTKKMENLECVLGSYLKKKICSCNKTIHFIFLVKNDSQSFLEKVCIFVRPTTCGLLTNSLSLNTKHKSKYLKTM